MASRWAATLTTEQRIALDSLHELPLVDALEREQRVFMKSSTYDAGAGAAFPNAPLLDCERRPVQLQVALAFADAKGKALKAKAPAFGQLHRVWNTDTEMPLLRAPSPSRLWESSRRQTEQGGCIHPAGHGTVTPHG